MTKVVNLRQLPFDVYIGRAGKGQDGYFGNPIKLMPGESRGSTLDAYRRYFYNRLNTDAIFKERIHNLKGKRSVVFVNPTPVMAISL